MQGRPIFCDSAYPADTKGPRSKHTADLRRRQPGRDEFMAAARWARTHDPSEAFRGQLEQALEVLGVSDHDGL